MTTVSGYDKPIADFVNALSATGHVTHVKYKKKSVTLHHNGGRLSLQGILNVWKVRPASAHFQSNATGQLGQYVHVQEYAWAVGNTVGNQESISIEMANQLLAPTWKVADVTWQSAARLAGWLFANVIDGRPAPSKSNFFYHHHWKPTECAGPYMDSIYDKVLAEAQKWYEHFRHPAPAPAPRPTTPAKPPVRKTNSQIAAEVWAGKWGSGEDRKARLRRAGYNPVVIQDLVNRGVGKGGVVSPPKPAGKSISTLAREVIDGKWGNGPDRKKRLTAAGYNYAAVQAEVNRRL